MESISTVRRRRGKRNPDSPSSNGRREDSRRSRSELQPRLNEAEKWDDDTADDLEPDFIDIAEMNPSQATPKQASPSSVLWIPTRTAETDFSQQSVYHSHAQEQSELPQVVVTARPHPRSLNDGANRFGARAVVVTVTQTQDAPTNTSSAGGPSSEIPIGVIVGSVAAGIIIAVGAVAGWIWWGKRIEQKAAAARRQKAKTTNIHAGPPRLAHSTNSARPSLEKYRSSSSGAGTKVAPANQISATTSVATGSGSSKRTSVGASNPRRASLQNTPPRTSSKLANSTTDAATADEPEGSATASATGVPGSVGRNYTPKKPSPLAQGAPKAQPSARVNEWGKPMARPLSQPADASASGSRPTALAPPAPATSLQPPSPSRSQPSPAAIAKRLEARPKPTSGGEEHPAPPYTPVDESQALIDRANNNRVSAQSAVSVGSQYSEDGGYYSQEPVGLAYGGEEDHGPHQYPPPNHQYQQPGPVPPQTYTSSLAYRNEYDEQDPFQHAAPQGR